MKNRANWIGGAEYHNLTLACASLNDAFGHGSVFLVGSSIKRRDFRDVDVRVILTDEEFDQLFPGLWSEESFRPDLHGLWSLMCASISEWLKARTGLPIDFQVQRMTQANVDHPRNPGRGPDSEHPRNGIGLFLQPGMPKYPGGG